MNEFKNLRHTYYQKPPVFDAIAKALNPNTNFTKALYGHKQGKGAGIFTPGMLANVRNAREMGQTSGISVGKLHALRGMVIGGNIVSAGLINIVFAVNNAVQNQKGAKRDALTLKIRPEINDLAGDYGLESHKDELLQMVLYRFGLGSAPSFWREGKRIARKRGGPQSVQEGRSLMLYRGYIQFEQHLAQVLQAGLDGN